MNKTFKKIDKKKQKRIINAALQEFAENSYEQASTNRIVKSAGIGKGMLFHYFNNKKDLYHFLVKHSLDIILHQYITLIDTNETDFIERFKQAARLKAKVMEENWHVFDLMSTLLLAQEPQLPEELEKQIEKLKTIGNEKLYTNINKDLFRKDVDVDKAYQIIRWSIEGYQKDVEMRLKGRKITDLDMDSLWDEFYAYLEVLKISFYTKEGEKDEPFFGSQ